GHKEVLRTHSNRRRIFDLTADPEELSSLVRVRTDVSAKLRDWLSQVEAGLAASDDLPLPDLDEESVDKLRSLGYID
ncbi:MAG: hypothetical protein V3T72_07485, partial [Thermoanaerobaculia bacterium]